MCSYAYYNGEFGKREDISIPLSDRSIFFGDAIYDAAIGSYDRILWESEHIDRFLKNAERIGINHNFTKEYLSALLREIAVKSMIKTYFLYFQLSRTLPQRVHSGKNCGASLLITVDPITIDKNPPPLNLITVKDQRYDYCDIKTINLLPSVLAATEADFRDCDEAVFIKNEIVTECSKSNISIINQGRVITHPTNSKILPGIARAHLIKKCYELNIPFTERPFTKEEMLGAEEILVTSTTKLCRTVSLIDGLAVGGGNSPLSHLLCTKLYREFADFCQI